MGQVSACGAGTGPPPATEASPWGPPTSSLWTSWTEAGGDGTQTDNTVDGQLDDLLIPGAPWSSGASFTTGGDTNRPTWVSSGIGGKPAWSFNGGSSSTTGQYAVRNGSGISGDFTVIYVIRPERTTGTNRLFSGNSSAKTILEINGGLIRCWNGAWSNTGATVSINTNYVIAHRFTATVGCETWVNGTSVGILAGYDEFNGAASGLSNYLGRDYNASGNGVMCKFALIGFRTAAMSSGDLVNEINSLKTRYSIA